MFTHTRTIFLKETDSTGVIYFASLLQYALEAFESLVQEKNSSLSQVFALGYFLPIVHAEADYKAPLRAGDRISITLELAHVGNKSFSVESTISILPSLKVAGTVKLVHAFLKQGDEKASEPSLEILNLLKSSFL